jgi:MFS family permease
MVHIVPYLESEEVTTAIAAAAVTGMTLCSLIGRLGFGLLGDFITKRYLIAVALSLQAVGLFLFALIGVETTWLIVPFLLIYAPGYGGPIPLKSAMQADYFGIRSFGTILGLMSVVSHTAGIISPILAGWIFDVTGSYDLAWQLFALATLPAIPLMLLAKPPKASREL